MHNAVKEAVRNGGQVGCLWLNLGSATVAEVAARTGPGAVVFDMQHGLWDLPDLHAAIGIAAEHATPIVRVTENASYAIGSVLDMGAMGVIVPMVEDAEQAARAVAYAHYPPVGCRSAGGMRPLKNFPAYVQGAHDAVLVAVMVETAKGLDNVNAIAATPGLDMIFIGPADLGLSIGQFPDYGDRHTAAVATIHQACTDAGIGIGMFTRSMEETLAYRDRGFHLVTLANDIAMVTAGAKEAVDAFNA
jgi:2-dehydro-3-deoxyglucarate aldolase/4-hydroxy-2-oxoheptanedioate aldolase